VLEVLLGFVDFASGRCDPALDTICAKARLARATVVRAIEALKAHGFLDKVRRTRRTGRGPAEGPQREQISNAYAFATRLAATVQQRFAQLVGGASAPRPFRRARRPRPPSVRRCWQSPCPVWAAPCTRPIRAWPASSMPWARTSTPFLLMAQVRVQ
jgi:DNA-binding transcriptional MocR family regulator